MAARSRKSRRRGQRPMVFSAENYKILAVSVFVVLVAYSMMRIENAVDGILSLYVSPILLLVGYLGVIWAILWTPHEDEEG